jgi:hypothetical protein
MHQAKRLFIELANTTEGAPVELQRLVAELLQREATGRPPKTGRNDMILAFSLYLEAADHVHTADEARRKASEAFGGPRDEREYRRICVNKGNSRASLLLTVDTEGEPLRLLLADGHDAACTLDPMTFTMTLPSGLWTVDIPRHLIPNQQGG